MQRSRVPLVLALVTFGLSLVSGTYAYHTMLRTVPVLTAVADIPAGAELKPDMVQVVRVPAGGRPVQALFGPGQVVGKYAAVPVLAEQTLTTRHLAEQAPLADPMAAALAPGERIVSVPVKSDAVLGGAMRPGDLVDVAAAWPGQDGKPGPVEVLATGVRVIDLRNAAGQSTQATSGDESTPESAVPSAVLLQVSGQQARSLVGAVESKAAIYLWLVGREQK